MHPQNKPLETNELEEAKRGGNEVSASPKKRMEHPRLPEAPCIPEHCLWSANPQRG